MPKFCMVYCKDWMWQFIVLKKDNIYAQITYKIWCFKFGESALMSQMQLLAVTPGISPTDHFLFIQHKVMRSQSWGTYTTKLMAGPVLVQLDSCVIFPMFLSKLIWSKSVKEDSIWNVWENWTTANCKNRGVPCTQNNIFSNIVKPFESQILCERKTNTSSENIVKRCQALYHNNNNDDDDEQEKKKRNTFVSFPFNDLTSVLTKVFIRLKSPWSTLPEPSNRNAISAWLGQSVKIIVIMFQVFPIPFYPIVIKIA